MKTFRTPPPQAHFAKPNGDIILVIQSFVIVTPGGARIIVDTCVGDGRERGSAGFHKLATQVRVGQLLTTSQALCSSQFLKPEAPLSATEGARSSADEFEKRRRTHRSDGWAHGSL